MVGPIRENLNLTRDQLGNAGKKLHFKVKLAFLCSYPTMVLCTCCLPPAHGAARKGACQHAMRVRVGDMALITQACITLGACKDVIAVTLLLTRVCLSACLQVLPLCVPQFSHAFCWAVSWTCADHASLAPSSCEDDMHAFIIMLALPCAMLCS